MASASASHSLLDQDSTVSSPLSDVIEAHPEALSNHSDDDELSDVDINSSEAETERLEISPRKTLGGPTLRATTTNTTTQNEQTATSSRVSRSLRRSPAKKLYNQIQREDEEEELSDEQEDADDEDEKASQSSPKQSPEPPIAASTNVTDDANKKRKRSSPPDHDDGPARKRTGSVAEPSDETSSLSKVTSEDLPPTNSTGGKSVEHFDYDYDVITMEDIAQATDQKQPADEHVPTVEVEDAAEAEVDEEAAEVAAIERKKCAFDQLASIEKNFALLREKLYDERLNELLHEEALLTAENPTHPEYLAMMQCIDSRRDERLSVIELECKYNMEAVDRWAVARRAQILSQFYQSVRESRERTLDLLGKEWYEIQHERRKNANPIPDFGIRFPKSKVQQKRQFIAHSKEISVLAGVAQHHGFPAAPEMKGAAPAEVEEDIEAMQRVRQSILGPPAHHAAQHAHHGPHAQHAQHAQPPQPIATNEYIAVPFGRNLGPAGEQFLEQTPWANPRHPSHGSRRHSHGAYAGPPAFLNQPRATGGGGAGAWFANGGQTNGDAASKHEAVEREPGGGHGRKPAGGAAAAKTKRETLVL